MGRVVTVALFPGQFAGAFLFFSPFLEFAAALVFLALPLLFMQQAALFFPFHVGALALGVFQRSVEGFPFGVAVSPPDGTVRAVLLQLSEGGGDDGEEVEGCGFDGQAVGVG